MTICSTSTAFGQVRFLMPTSGKARYPDGNGIKTDERRLVVQDLLQSEAAPIKEHGTYKRPNDSYGEVRGGSIFLAFFESLRFFCKRKAFGDRASLCLCHSAKASRCQSSSRSGHP